LAQFGDMSPRAAQTPEKANDPAMHHKLVICFEKLSLACTPRRGAGWSIARVYDFLALDP